LQKNRAMLHIIYVEMWSRIRIYKSCQ